MARLRSDAQFIVSGNSVHLMFAEEQDHRGGPVPGELTAARRFHAASPRHRTGG